MTALGIIAIMAATVSVFSLGYAIGRDSRG